MFDVAVIGAGVIGNAICRELTRLDLNIALIDRENDVSNGTTKANSAIIHAGYDCPEGSLMAKFNVLGNEMFDKLCDELDVEFKRIGSYVLAFSKEEAKELNNLYQRGLNNNVPNMHIVSGDEIRKSEPNLSKEVVAGLLAKTAGIVGPFELAIALAENAVDNGATLLLNNEVKDIKKEEDYYTIITNNDEIKAKYVINAAGVYADKIHNMVAKPTFKITPRRGQYYVLDKSCGSLVNHVMFQCPTKLGKGVLVTPTVHGNLLVGPDAQDLDDKEALETTSERLSFIANAAKKTVENIPMNMAITEFAGLRAQPDVGDFIIEEAKDAKNFIDVAGIKSPGLSSAPAIAEYVMNMIKDMGDFKENKDFNPIRRKMVRFDQLTDQQKAQIIKEDERYARIICRCENITEGEIIDCIKRNAGATTVDGVKKRVRPGMGRCQGGFCGPRVMEIIAKELNKDMQEVVKTSLDSNMLVGRTKNQ